MKTLLLLLIVALPAAALAQTEVAGRPPRSGFLLGGAAGGGVIGMTGGGVEPGRHARVSAPNLKVGYFLSDRTALLVLLPGTIYTYRGVDESDRTRDRGFEGIVPSAQHWLGERWWVIGGAGLALDAPAFYDIEGPADRKFYVGAAVIAGTGYELWRKGGLSSDVQLRLHGGRVRVPGGEGRDGVSLNLLMGLSAY